LPEIAHTFVSLTTYNREMIKLFGSAAGRRQAG
jgi:hypothetical protein